MRAGKLSQTVWRRSVRKQLDTLQCIDGQVLAGSAEDGNVRPKETGGALILHPSEEEMCAAVRTAFGQALLTAAASAQGNSASTGIYAIVKAVQDLCSRGALPMGVSVQLLLPEWMEEPLLKELAGQMNQWCRKLQVPLAGLQTEVNPAVCQILVHAVAFGTAEETGLLCPARVHEGQDIVLCGYIGLEGMLRILDECEEELQTRFVSTFLRKMKDDKEQLLQTDTIQIVKQHPVAAVQQIGSGGILGALWEVAEAAHIGLYVDLEKMSIRQETVEVCEYFRLNPYQMTSAGSFLVMTEEGAALVRALKAAGKQAVLLGGTTAEKARVVTNGEERRFLDRPAPDELMLWWERKLRQKANKALEVPDCRADL